MEMTVKTIATNILDFSSQHIAVTLWAVAKLDYNPGKDILQVRKPFQKSTLVSL